MNDNIKRLNLPPGFLSGIIFFAVVILGSGYIVVSKMSGVGAVFVTLVPVLIMIGYALLLGLARFFRLRDDQSGDNLYYMGFLFTLTSLAVSLYQFSNEGAAEQIVKNFGVAIASTIAGIALRIFFNQMRRDPIEIEHASRLELAEASRRVKRELETTVLEFSFFRRATQQAITDALEEVNTLLAEAKDRFVGQLEEFANTSSKPIEEASVRSGSAINDANTRIADALEEMSRQVADESVLLKQSTAEIIGSLDAVVGKLKSIQTPDQIIEIKLTPAVQGLTRAVNTFAKAAEAQSATADEQLKKTLSAFNENLKQMQYVAGKLTQMFDYFRARDQQIAASSHSDQHPEAHENVQSGYDSLRSR